MPDLKPASIIQDSKDPDVTCYAKLLVPDGAFITFEINRGLAYGILTEMAYHLRRQEGIQANAPVETPAS